MYSVEMKMTNNNFKKVQVLALALLSIFAIHSKAQQSEGLSVPDAYQVEGVPTINKDEVGHLFYDPATIGSNLIWDADRRNRRLLVTDQTNNIYLLSSPLAQPVKLIEKVVPNSVKVRPDGQTFLY